MGKAKFQASWIKSYPWVKPLKNSENHANCTVCSSISMFLLVLHNFSYTKKPKNKDAVNDPSRQSKFVFNKDGKITLTGGGKSKALSTEDQVAKAKIILCFLGC